MDFFNFSNDCKSKCFSFYHVVRRKTWRIETGEFDRTVIVLSVRVFPISVLRSMWYLAERSLILFLIVVTRVCVRRMHVSKSRYSTCHWYWTLCILYMTVCCCDDDIWIEWKEFIFRKYETHIITKSLILFIIRRLSFSTHVGYLSFYRFERIW